MRIAFYAPMKPPSSAVPSGDRQMARLIVRALEMAGHEVTLASIFRSRDGSGDRRRQQRLAALGNRLAERVLDRYRRAPATVRPEAWLTYHLYHKAPDWIGPAVSADLGIPYLVAEASFAPKQEGGRWATGHAAAEDAIRAADAVICLNGNDVACLRPLLSDAARLHRLRPFTDVAPFDRAADDRNTHRAALARDHGLDPEAPWLLCVAMMRGGDKLASYRVLGEALAMLGDERWQLVVVGDGPARPAVEDLFAGLADRVRFLGQREVEELPPTYAASDVYVWPAIREAYGMAVVEAQAAGLAVVAGNAGGVADIVRDGETGLLTPEGDAAAFARALRRLLRAPDARADLAAGARRLAVRDHSLEAASGVLDRVLAGLSAVAIS